MKITYIHIKNFKSIRDLEIAHVENALILVGRNNTGKTVVIDAIRIVSGDYQVCQEDYLDNKHNIVIRVKVKFDKQDLDLFHKNRIVSKYKRKDLWYKDFKTKLPSYMEREGELCFDCIVTRNGIKKYSDGYKKNNPYIASVFPKVYHIDHSRDTQEMQKEILRFYDKNSMDDLQKNKCIFDKARRCNRCFHCIAVINKKTPDKLSLLETSRLMEYKIYHTNLNEFSDKLNQYFHVNGSSSNDIQFVINYNIDEVLKIEAMVYNKDRKTIGSIERLSEGLKSIYALSLLETYAQEEETIPCILLIEDPEIFLHPQLQKVASEILYRLSKKNQVIFSTHAPNMFVNFSTKQIRQVVLDKEYYTIVKQETDIDEILEDLGYTANDFMNVGFVFIVEGKQDKSRLPLLLEKYYSEIYDEKGNLQRIAIITTNSCTNIKTYANLKYINNLYLKDQFLMIRDSDGKNPEQLAKQLCYYYEERSKEDIGNLPRITKKNVLILRYYSFENYFLDTAVMKKIGILSSEEEFYHILFEKYNEYLYRIPSMKNLIEKYALSIEKEEDLKNNIELIKIYVRGHNLYNIFYSKYKGEKEIAILKKYIDTAPRETFADILDAIDQFIYFQNRRKIVNNL